MRDSVAKTYLHDVASVTNTYKGIPMLCAAGLHENIVDTTGPLLKPGQKVLDLGCGRGALSLRLSDLGVQVTAVDMFDVCMCRDAVTFVCSPIEEFLRNDSNTYDAIYLVEILEHVESPFSVIRAAYDRLKDGGILIISTPNIESDFSRTCFFLLGEHWFFEKKNVARDGHINPLHSFQIEFIFNGMDLELLMHYSTCAYERRIHTWRFHCLLFLLRLYKGWRKHPRNDGVVQVFVGRRSTRASQ